MILLNGLPVILGATIMHVFVINIIAILTEYLIIKRQYEGNRLILRVILANLISVVAGTFVVYLIPSAIGHPIAKPDDYIYTAQDQYALGLGLLVLFLSNVLLETPAYFIGLQRGYNRRKLLLTIFVANLVTNIPVCLIYLIVTS